MAVRLMLLAFGILLYMSVPAAALKIKISGIWLALAGNQGSVGRIQGGSGLNAQELLAIQQPFVEGAYVSDNWKDIEPRPGEFDFSRLDYAISQIANAGKKVRIGIRSGNNSPEWIFREVLTYRTVNPVNEGRCRSIRIPMPFDATYLSRFNNMVDALGEHYRRNQAVIGVVMTGITRTTEEVWAPSAAGQVIDGCQTRNDVAALKRFGWTQEKVIFAWKAMLSHFATAFPTQYVTIDGCGESPIPHNAMPAIGLGGADDPNATKVCSQHFLVLSKAALGERFTALNASWQVGSFDGSTGVSYEGIGAVNEFGLRTGAITGFQTAWVLSSDDLRCAPSCDPVKVFDAMISELQKYSRASYVEAMSDDLVDSRLTSRWIQLRNWLQSR